MQPFAPGKWPWDLERGVRPTLQAVMTSDLQDAKGGSTASRIPKGHARPPSAGTPDMLGRLWLLYDTYILARSACYPYGSSAFTGS